MAEIRHTMIGDALNAMQDSGCSFFFLTSSVLSIFNGMNNRDNQIEEAQKEERFQELLRQKKEAYEDEKEAKEMAFKIWIKLRQREYARHETSIKWDYKKKQDELAMFFKDWPLLLSLEAIDKARKVIFLGTLPLNVVIAKPLLGMSKDPITLNYDKIVDGIKDIIKKHGIVENHVLRFNPEKNTTYGGAALANIYAMMSTFPTVVIIPRIDEKNNKIIFSTGCWNQDSIFPAQRKAITIDYDMCRMRNDKSYLQSKINEIVLCCATIATVMNDVYMLLEEQQRPRFPNYSNSNLKNRDMEYLRDFARREFQSLENPLHKSIWIDNIDIRPMDVLFAKSLQNCIKVLLSETIESIN